MGSSVSSDVRQLAVEVFLTTAGPLLVRDVAQILGRQGIPVMPLKGVVLQKLVYREGWFRPISDVDLVVPEERFFEAYSALRVAGFTQTRWEDGRWQVVMRNPSGPPLNVDLHRRLSRTYRGRLSTAGMFERSTTDTQTFGAPVALPCGNDLLAHVLLHATLHWIALEQLHCPEDFQAIADALSLDARQCANHLRRQGLVTHALVLLPLVFEQTASPFVQALLMSLRARPFGEADPRIRAALIRAACARFGVRHPARRAAGALLAPSIFRTVFSAVRDRLQSLPRTE